MRFIHKALRHHGKVEAITTDGLRSYGAAMAKLGNRHRRGMGQWLNDRAENSHLPSAIVSRVAEPCRLKVA